VPEVSKNDPFNAEISHFVDCCLKKAECICPVDEAVRLMEIIDAIYKSADTGAPVIF
jgi:predicted dehydrogenase